jgi:hypothetical protein
VAETRDPAEVMKVSLPERPARVLVAGDTHGDLDWWEDVLLPAAVDGQADVIAQLGDFGYWPYAHDRESQAYVGWLSGQLEQRGLMTVFIDGNHEDFRALGKLRPGPDGFVAITDRIYWAPRGHRWVWSGVRFLALGGAYSIDRAYRRLGAPSFGWFEEEVISSQQAGTAKAGGSCDVLLTHDAPEGMVPYLFPEGGLMADPPAGVNRQAVQAVMEATRPSLLLHGHYHRPAHACLALPSRADDDGPAEAEVYSLDCNRAPAHAFGILALPSLVFTSEAGVEHPARDQRTSLERGGARAVAAQELVPSTQVPLPLRR